MAFNNYYPFQYYPQQAQMQGAQMSLPNQPQQTGIIWVQGEAGAKSYLVAPNTTVQLWDSERQVIYLKSADASGMPSMKVLDYIIRDRAQTDLPVNTRDNVDYVTRDEFDALKEQIQNIIEKREARRNEHHANVDATKK